MRKRAAAILNRCCVEQHRTAARREKSGLQSGLLCLADDASSRAGPLSRRLVSTVESRASIQFFEAQPDDGLALDDPAQVVTGAICRRPERAETPIFVEVPLALCGTTVRLYIARLSAWIKRLRRAVVEAQPAGRHCSRDQRGRNRLAVNDLDIFQPLHRITQLTRSASPAGE